MFFRTLPASAQRVFTKLGREKALQPFYLAGGSAVALHLAIASRWTWISSRQSCMNPPR